MSLFTISDRYARQAVAEAVAAATEAAEMAANAEAFDPDAWAADMSALALCQQLARRLDVPLDQVWHSLCHVPDNLLGLLETPEGWGVLSSHVAVTLGREAAQYVPAVH